MHDLRARNSIAAPEIVCVNPTAGAASLTVGVSGTDPNLNGRIRNLAYGRDALDACPKKQIEEMLEALDRRLKAVETALGI